MDNTMNSDFVLFLKPVGRPSLKPLGVRKMLFDKRNKENEESMLCKDFADREVTGTSPVVVPQRLRNGPDDNQEEKIIKPRRSMLGRRSKLTIPNLSKDDITYTLTKPLYSSSPVNPPKSLNSFLTEDKPVTRLHEAPSAAVLSNPFDLTDADASSFFLKGHRFQSSENKLAKQIWMEKNEQNTSDTGVSADQKLKLESLAMKFQMESNLRSSNTAWKEADMKSGVPPGLRKSYRNEKAMTLKQGTTQLTSGARTRAQTKKEKEKKSYEVSPIRNENIPMNNQVNSCSLTMCESGITEESMDSYVHNEATIVGALNLVNGKKDSSVVNIEEEACKDSDYSEDYLSLSENSSVVFSSSNLITVIKELKKEKTDLNDKWAAFVQQKEAYDEKFDKLMSFLDGLSYDSLNIVSKEKRRKPGKCRNKNFISSKVIHSSVSSTPGTTKTLTGLKATFNCLKTPVRTNEKLRKLRKSTCYTPTSLSALVGNQLKDIFGDN